MKLGLETTKKLLAALGNPLDKTLKIQVVGTNGKGSVCAFLDAIALSANITCGSFTSPHLISPTERIRINGRNIPEEEFAELTELVAKTIDGLLKDGKLSARPTFFEHITAIGALALERAGVKLAILETGLGGRLDAVTALNSQIIAFTRIGLDHQQYLGNDLISIAREKAAALHKQCRAVLGLQVREVKQLLISCCRRLDLEFYDAGEVLIEQASPILSEKRMPAGKVNFITPRNKLSDVTLSLEGSHQLENAAVAILAAELISDFLPIPPEAIKTGLENAVHPGRLEKIGSFILDGAHNIDGIIALKNYLKETKIRPILIFGAMRDKDVTQMLELLLPDVYCLIATEPQNQRSAKADEIASMAKNIAQKLCPDLKIVAAASSQAAVEIAKNINNETENNQKAVVVAGSLYLVGEVRKILIESYVS